MDQLRKGTARNQFFQVKWVSGGRGGRENLTLDHLKRNLAQFFVAQTIKHTLEHGDATGVVAYAGAAAQKLKLSVFGAPPGLGSSMKVTGGDITLYIDPEPGDLDKHLDGNKLYLEYYQKSRSSFVIDNLHYVDFKVMLAAPLPDPGWATERFAVYFDESLKQQILRLPSGIEIYRAPREPSTTPSLGRREASPATSTSCRPPRSAT